MIAIALLDLLRRSLQFQRPAAWNESLIAAAHSIVMSGWRPLIKGYFAVAR
jgi:hypothetical protein